MSTETAITILIDFAASCLLIYGFIHEDKVIDFEQNLKRIIIGNIRRAIRIRKYKKKMGVKQNDR